MVLRSTGPQSHHVLRLRGGIAHFTGPSCQRRMPESKHVDRLLASSPKLKRHKLEQTDSQKSFWEARVGFITSCNVVLSVSLEVYVLLYKLGSSDTRTLLPGHFANIHAGWQTVMLWCSSLSSLFLLALVIGANGEGILYRDLAFHLDAVDLP